MLRTEADLTDFFQECCLQQLIHRQRVSISKCFRLFFPRQRQKGNAVRVKRSPDAAGQLRENETKLRAFIQNSDTTSPSAKI